MTGQVVSRRPQIHSSTDASILKRELPVKRGIIGCTHGMMLCDIDALIPAGIRERKAGLVFQYDVQSVDDARDVT